jgi:DNA-binding MurR/RpiR family transcriptional regulator
MSTKKPESNQTPLGARLCALGDVLTKSEAVIARWLILNEATLALETGASIAAKTGVSEITVSRFLRRAGFKGLAGLKEELKLTRIHHLASTPDYFLRLIDGGISAFLKRDAEAILAIAEEIKKPTWKEAIKTLAAADEVYVTGFQTVRGLAEDFARRLGIVRSTVRFLSPHDDGLVEWIPSERRKGERRCLVLVDMVPYAREALPIVRTAREAQIDVVIVTDILNTWAAGETPFVFHVTTKMDTFLESTGPMTTMMNVIIHAVASENPEKAHRRIGDWPPLIAALGLY